MSMYTFFRFDISERIKYGVSVVKTRRKKTTIGYCTVLTMNKILTLKSAFSKQQLMKTTK